MKSLGRYLKQSSEELRAREKKMSYSNNWMFVNQVSVDKLFDD